MANEDLEKRTEEEIDTSAVGEGEIGESTLGEYEPWDPWETKLVLWSIGIGVGGLVVLGAIINATILN